MKTLPWRLDAANPLSRQHRVLGEPTLPLAVWLVKSIEAIAEIQDRPPRALRDFRVRELLRFASADSVSVQCSATPDGKGGGHFDVRRAGAADEVLVAGGDWGADDADGAAVIAPGRGRQLDQSHFYQTATAMGLSYGPLLQRVAGIEFGDEAWTAELSAAERVADPAAELAADWDALLQCGAVLASHGGACWVPFHVERLGPLEYPTASRAPLRQARGRWRASFASPQRRVADLFGYASDGERPAVAFLGVHYALLNSTAGIALPEASPASAADAETGGPKQILERLRGTPPQARRALLQQYIEEQLLAILKWDASRRADLPRGFAAVGLDSLMSVDLQFRLQTSLKFALKPGQGLNLPSVAALADFLLERHLRFDEAT